MPIRYETLNPLPVEAREQVIELLNRLMADILDNHYQTLLAHWNTRGPNFKALHDFFYEYGIGNGADNWCDWVAERIGQLGGPVLTTIPYIAANTRLKEFPVAISSGEDHLRALAASASAIIGRLREGIARAEALGDGVTASILADVQRSAEKYLWLMEAHFQARSAENSG
jgi:starvation-inducible DNA-binding protein